MKSLPSLKAIQVFEASGRHQSFTKAAEELNVTPGAISRQIRLLEDEMGVALFARGHREVRLTPVGFDYFQAVSQSFQSLKNATRQIAENQRRKSLHVWCSQTFAMRWLMPRLPDFHHAYPQHDITLTTSLRPVDFTKTTADVAIRLGTGFWPRTICHRLVSMDLTPVCSPKLAEGVKRSEDLSQFTFLHSMARPEDWSRWLASVGLKELAMARSMSFENSLLTYQAARNGLGVAMAHRQLVEEDLASGQLVAPLPHMCADDKAFYLIYPERSSHPDSLRDFRRWILQACGTSAG